MMKSIKTLGCCDSGIGGLISIHELHKTYPNLDIVFIADQLNSPYGDKSIDELNDIAVQLFKTFEEMGVKDILVACNTLCCNGAEYAKTMYPDLNVTTIIEPTYNQLKKYDFSKINILATERTIDTHVYKNALSKLFPNASIKEIKASKIVPIIENGFNEELLKEAVKEYCKDDADAWILGCTHYPLIRPYMETKGMIFDSIQPMIELLKDVEIEGEGKVSVYTTKDPEELKKTLNNLLNCDYDIQYIKLKQS